MHRHIASIVGWLLALGLAWPHSTRAQDGQPEAGSAAQAQRYPAPTAPRRKTAAKPVDPAKMESLLREWERNSSQLKTLDVRIYRVVDTPGWGDPDYYEGRALFKSPNLAFIDFRKIKVENNQPLHDPQKKNAWLSTPNERIICTGSEIWQYDCETQQIFIYPLEKDEQKKAIEEGPLPFLFNMHANDAKRRYQMTLMSEDEKGYGISIKPKLKEDLDSFSTAFVRLDRDLLLPLRIVLISPDGKSTSDYQLSQMVRNGSINEKNFEGKVLGKQWKVVRNPAGDERPRSGVTRRRRGDAAAAGSRASANQQQ
ncbi:MAG: outer-membrane lipoprotein carrier protein LolA [Planctomycetaceae bacterium]|nr:outer-membrane lipoprotein carrier protein LolA [Planctomycetaceae bacterium]